MRRRSLLLPNQTKCSIVSCSQYGLASSSARRKNAFLNGDQEEDVYMEVQPVETRENSRHVCKLQKSLYGLKQSPHDGFERLTKVVKKVGSYNVKQTIPCLLKVLVREKEQS